MPNMNDATITLPKKVFKDFIQATERIEQVQNTLEDLFLTQDKKFIANMNKLRREHKKGHFADWSGLKSKYGL